MSGGPYLGIGDDHGMGVVGVVVGGELERGGGDGSGVEGGWVGR